MASILRRGDSYSVRFKYKDHAGRICEGWESFKTKKEAQDRKISVEKELLDGTFLIPDAMTVAEMLYKWLPIQSSKHKWAPKTYTHTVAMIQNLVVPYLGKKQIQKVQTYDLEQFYATLSRTPRGLYKQGVKQTLTDKQKRQFLTGASIREVHAMLKTAFSYAVEWGLLLKSPIPREAPKSTSEERAIWDEKTMLAALQTMTDPTLHLAVHLSMILSLRVGEILGLQPGDIDFDAADGRGTITVGRSLQRTEKAALERPIRIRSTTFSPTSVRQQLRTGAEEAENQEIQPANPLSDETLERGTAGLAGKAPSGRACHGWQISQLRSAFPLAQRYACCPGSPF